MEDEIKVGEYVRSNLGSIGKVTKIEDGKFLYENKCLICFISNVVQHSKNLFKLLEGEDITVLEYYVGKYRKRIARRFEVFKVGHLISFRNVYCDFLYDLNEQKFLDGKGFNPKIKLILTHEQFDWLKYKV